MKWFWKLFGYKYFYVNVGDWVRLELFLQDINDHRKLNRIYDLVQILSVTKHDRKYYYYCFRYSNKLNTDGYIDSKIICYSNNWGGLKPLSNEDKLELL